MFRWFLLLLLCFSFPSFAQVQDSLFIQSDNIPEYEPHTLLVRVNPGLTEVSNMKLNRPVSGTMMTPELSSLFEEMPEEIMRIADTRTGKNGSRFEWIHPEIWMK